MKIPFLTKKAEENTPKIRLGASQRITKKARLSARTLEPLSGKPKKPGLLKFTLGLLYKNLYLLGITLMRKRLRLLRRARRYAAAARMLLRLQAEGLWYVSLRLLKGFWDRLKAPFLRIRRTYKEVKPQVEVKRAMGKLAFAEFFTVAETVFRLIFKIISTIFNYAAPVAAAAFLVVALRQWMGVPNVYTVQYKGEIIGYVDSQSEFFAAAGDVRERTTIDGETAFEIVSPHFELMRLSDFRDKRAGGEIPRTAGKLTRDELADTLIRMSGSTVEEAYGLYIDDEFYGAIQDKDIILDEFDRMRKRSVTGKPDEIVSFARSIKLKPGLYLQDSIAPEYVILGEITRNETAEEIYIVKEGDTPTGIADKIGVPYRQLKELNPTIEEELFAGMELLTQVAKPFLSVETSYTDIVVEDVAYETVETPNATYARGYRNVFQEGEPGSRRVTYKVTAVDGVELERQELSFVTLRNPVEELITVGVNAPPPVSQPAASGSSGTQQQAPVAQKPGGFIWPVGGRGGRITCYLNGYPGHTGVDIAQAGGRGTPILASASGTVVLAKNGVYGYGRHIIIQHDSGYTTLYGHNSELYVSVGDRVSQGQIIAAMGSTGNSYGVHVHFEVRHNGRIMNPVNYIGG